MRLVLPKSKLYGTLPYVLIVAGLVGFIASFVLTYDKLHVLQNPSYDPPCNINPILSCGSVMKTEQADLFGMPNTIYGLVAFTALITFGFMLAAGAQLKRWIWQAAQAAAILGVIFMHYLFFQSVYRISAICVWCFAVWMVTIPLFVFLTAFNIRAGNLPLPKSLKPAGMFFARNSGNILLVWYMIIFLILFKEFWYYWSTLL